MCDMDESRARPIDVICQHTRNGTLIPLRIRIKDDEGEYQAYRIQGYKDLSHLGTREMPDGMYVTDSTLVFECRISVLGSTRTIRLYYDSKGTIWRMTA